MKENIQRNILKIFPGNAKSSTSKCINNILSLPANRRTSFLNTCYDYCFNRAFLACCVCKPIGSSTGTVLGQILILALEGLHSGGVFLLTTGEFAVHGGI